MQMNPPPFGSPIEAYQQQAVDLLAGWEAHDKEAVRIFRCNLPRFVEEKTPWVRKQLSEEELRSVPLTMDDARTAVARRYSFLNWESLASWVNAVREPGSAVGRFEAAVEAVISGDAVALRKLLAAHPELVRARSTIVTHHDSNVHRATLLHYTAANGVEGFRQKTPANAVEIAKILLDAGAEADALADMYGGQCTTLSMLITSAHPANAGLQVALVDTLIDYGTDVDGRCEGEGKFPVLAALAHGYGGAADALVRRGASVHTLPIVAGLGRLEDVVRLLPAATAMDRHRALALSAQHGHVEVVRLLLDAAEDPNRLNPRGHHAHSTPLHQAAWGGHLAVVRLLVERGARMDIEDTVHHGTPLGWALHGGHTEVAAYLRERRQSGG